MPNGVAPAEPDFVSREAFGRGLLRAQVFLAPPGRTSALAIPRDLASRALARPAGGHAAGAGLRALTGGEIGAPGRGSATAAQGRTGKSRPGSPCSRGRIRPAAGRRSTQGLYGDELFTYATVVGHSFGHVLGADLQNNPPLFYVLAWASAKLGDPDTTIRLPSLVLGTAAVPMTYALGLRAAGPLGGRAWRGDRRPSPFAVILRSEARGYAAVMFFAPLSTYLLLVAIERGGRRWWALYAVASRRGRLHALPGCLRAAGPDRLGGLGRPGVLRPLPAANAAVALGCLPLVGALGGERVTEAPVRAGSVLSEAPEDPVRRARGPLERRPGNAGGDRADRRRCHAARRCGRPASRGRAPGNRLPPRRSRNVLLAMLALATPVGFVLYSLVGSSTVLGRYMLPSLPAIGLLFGAALDSPAPAGAGDPRRRRGRPSASARSGASSDQYERPDYREPAAFIDREFRRET